MSEPVLDQVVKHVRTLAGATQAGAIPDEVLLGRFVSHLDEGAFETLVQRHGAMVLRVARRVLHSDADADDVFQATFLLLAHKAGSIRKRQSVASWLHGVAHRLALHTRGQHERRTAREQTAATRRPQEHAAAWNQLDAVLDEALAGLPEKYRTPLVHCYLEGHTQEEVAKLMGTPLGTVRAWVARGREMLRKRLVRRGVALSAGGLGTILLASAANARAVPAGLLRSTLHAAVAPASTRKVPVAVAALVRFGLTTMLLARLRASALGLAAAALLLVGVTFACLGTARDAEGNRPELQSGIPTAEGGVAEPQTKVQPDGSGDPLPPDALARLGSIRFRHEDRISSFASSPDGKILAGIGGENATLWDAATGKPLQRLSLPDVIQSIAFSPDGKAVALGSGDCVVHLLDRESGKELQQFKGHDSAGNPGFRGLWAVDFKDAKTLVTWGSDGTVRIWEVNSGKELRRIDLGDGLVHALSADGRLLAYHERKSPKTLRLLDLASGEVRTQDFDSEIRRVAFAGDSKRLAVGLGATNKPGKIVISDTTGEQHGVLAGHDSSVFALAFGEDGKTLVSGGYDHTLRLWDIETKKELHKSVLASPIYQVALAQGGKSLILLGAENRLRPWDIATWKEHIGTPGMSQPIYTLAWSPDGRQVVCASSNSVWLWDAESGKLVHKLDGPTHGITQAAFAADGKTVLTGDGDGLIRIWDMAGGKEQRSFDAGTGAVELLALAPDGKTIAVWGDNDPTTMHVLNTATGKMIRTLHVSSSQPQARPTLRTLSMSSGGTLLYGASGTNLGILRWNLATGEELPSLGQHDGALNGLALSADERMIGAVSMGGTLYIWERATGQPRLVVKDIGYATSVAFSPDGRNVALANAGAGYYSVNGKKTRLGMDVLEQVRIVRVADGKVIHRFRGHAGGVASLHFSPDGMALASGGYDTTVLLWKMTGLTAEPKQQALGADELAALWKALDGKADTAHEAMNKLVAAPGQAVKMIGDHLKPVPAPDLDRFAALVKDLGSDMFKTRSAAAEELKKMGPSIEKPLRKAVADIPIEEVRRRLEKLLTEIGAADPPTPERIRTLRALEVLERIGDRDAQALLRRLADGADGAWMTEIAKESLRRLERGKK
jgi:RNA polymerase sigma factor (sigma-70 family)